MAVYAAPKRKARYIAEDVDRRYPFLMAISDAVKTTDEWGKLFDAAMEDVRNRLPRDADAPDLPDDAGRVRWLQEPVDAEEGVAEAEKPVEGAKTATGDPTGCIQRWWNPVNRDWEEAAGARDLPANVFADAGQAIAASGGRTLGYFDVWKLRSRMPGALAGDYGPAAKDAAQRVLDYITARKKTLDDAFADTRGGANAGCVRDFVSICGRPPEELDPKAEDAWLWGYGYHREADVAIQKEDDSWQLSGLSARATDGLIAALDSGNDEQLEAVLGIFYPEGGPPDDLPEEWRQGQAKLPESDVFPRGASFDAYMGTARQSQLTYDDNLRLGVDHAKYCEIITAAATYSMASFGLHCRKIGTGGDGDVVVKVYSGGTPGSGALLKTLQIAISDIVSPSYYQPIGGGLTALTNGQSYWIEITPTGSPNAGNYIEIHVKDTGLGGTFYYWNGSAWVQYAVAAGLCYEVYDNANGGTLVNRVSTAASVVQSTTKGAALSSTDQIYTASGATFTYDQNTPVILHVVGTFYIGQGGASRAAVAATATYRYGHITVAANVTVTFTGNATATSSGFLSNPASADTSSKSSTLTINGTAASPTVFTNSAGAYSATARYCINWVYGVYGTFGVLRCNYPSGAAGTCVIGCPASATYTTSSSHSLGTISCVVGASGAINTAFVGAGATGARTIPIVVADMTIDETAVVGTITGMFAYYEYTPAAGATTSSAGFFVNRFYQISPVGGNAARLGFIYLAPTTGVNFYGKASGVSTADNRPTQVVPTGLAIADRADGSGGLATITNRVSYAATDELIVTSSAAVVIGRCTFAEYDLNSGCLCPNVTMDVLRAGDKAKATSDLSTEGAYSDAAAGWTPHKRTVPAVTKVMADAGDYGDGGTELTPTLPLNKVHADQGGTLDLPAIASVCAPDTLEGVPGTADLPAIASVVSPDTLLGVTGAFVEADRNTDPTVAKVLTGTTYKICNVSKTGAMAAGVPNAAFEVLLDDPVPAVGGTLTITGGITFDMDSTGVSVALTRYRDSDGLVVHKIIETTADFVAGVQKTWADILGAAATTVPDTARQEYITASVSSGTPAVTSETSAEFPLVVIPAFTTPSLTVVDDEDGSVTCTVATNASQTSRLKYLHSADSTWTVHGTSIAGNGTISNLTGLSKGVGAGYYKFQLVPYDATTGLEGPGSLVTVLHLEDSTATVQKSDFEDEFEDGLAEVLSERGISATYNPYGGTPSTVTVAWEQREYVSMEDPETHKLVYRSSVWGVTASFASPDRRDTFTIDGVVYPVKDQPLKRAGRWTFELERVVRVAQAGGAIRRA